MRLIFNPSVLFIISAEFFERFCFYSLRSTLFDLFIQKFNLTIYNSKLIVHSFLFLCYSFCFVFGILSDNVLGSYYTILISNLIYLLGITNCYIAYRLDSLYIMLSGLVLVAIATGGIKSNISNFGALQLRKKDRSNYFGMFYLTINVGSLISIMSAGQLTSTGDYRYCYLMSISACITSNILFLAGTKLYKTRIDNDTVEDKQHTNIKDKMISVMKLISLGVFFCLFDQQSTSWTLQASQLDNSFLGLKIRPSQMQLLNSLFVILFIPPITRLLSSNIHLKPHFKLGLGVFICSLSFVCCTVLQFLSNNIKLNIMYQVPQYILITIGEIIFCVSGLQMTYEKSKNKKGTAAAMWQMANAIGNIWTIMINRIMKNGVIEYQMLVYTIMGFVGSLAVYIIQQY